MKNARQSDRLPTRLATRILSFVLMLTILIPAFPMDVLAATVSGNALGQMVITDADGNQTVVDESWEARFPYGTFAFGEVQLELTEGDASASTVTLTLHRLGGTAGRAEADIVLMPATTTLDDGVLSYANAAGNTDYEVAVELPQPIAYFQPLGGTDVGYVASPLEVCTDYNQSTDNVMDWSSFPPTVAEYGEQKLFVPAAGTSNTLGVQAVPVAADSYRWQLRDMASAENEWVDISDAATGAFLPISNQIFYSNVQYDFRCIFTVDGVTYCSTSYYGETYVPPVSDVEPIPAGFVNELDPGMSGVALTGEEFSAQGFTVIFAEGEEKKEIVFTVNDDALAEADEFLLINILQARGAVLYDSANTISLHITDNEPMAPSFVGFSAATAAADKASGSVRLTLTRTGGLQYPVTVPFTYLDGTAKVGTDYAGTTGTAYFAPGTAETYIDLELIQAGAVLTPDQALTMSIVLGEVQGGGEGSTLMAGRESMLLFLYNTGSGVDAPNLATLLYGEGVDDVSGDLSVTDNSIVGGTTAVVTGTPVEQTSEYLAGTIVDGVQGRSYNFGGKTVTFSRLLAGYNNSYWRDWENVVQVDTQYSYGNTDSNSFNSYLWGDMSYTNKNNEDTKHSGFIKTYGTAYFGPTAEGIVLEHNGDASANVLTIRGAGALYDQVYLHTIVDRIGFDRQHENNQLAVMPAIQLKNSKNKEIVSSVYTSSSYADRAYNGYFYWNQNGVAQKTGTLDYDDDIKISMRLERYRIISGSGRYTGSNNAYDATLFVVRNLQLRRRVFEKELKLLIHTANDRDVVTGMASSSTDISVLADYSLLEPTIELVPGKAGVTSGGKLYVGSTLRVGVGNSAAFDPVTNENGPVVFLTNSKNKIVATAGSAIKDAASGKYYYELKLLWNGMSDSDLTDQYTVNVAMQRKQTITVSYLPSLSNAKGNRGDDAATKDFFVYTDANGNQTGDRVFRYGNAVYQADTAQNSTTNYPAYFTYQDYYTTGKTSCAFWDYQGTVNKTAHTISYTGTNIYWVNLGQDKEDRILYNGKVYEGDDTIVIDPADLNNTVINFVWYDEDYLTATADMQPAIARMERYLDLNGDGRVSGTYNESTGIFTPDQDLLLGAFMADSTYEITTLQPMRNPNDLADKTYYQQVIKVYYNKVPRSLNPQVGKETHQGQVVPYLVTGITSESVRSTLSPAELAMRYLSTTETVPIYGAEAQALARVDVPLGGDTTPPKLVTDASGNREWKWASRAGIRGHLLENFNTLSPVYIRWSLLGQDYPVIEDGVKLNPDGSYTLSDTAKAVLNNYLGSLNSDDTFGISIRELDASGTPQHYEAAAASGLATFPDASIVQSLSGGGQDGMTDSENSGNPMSEFNIDTGVELPTFNFGLTDYISIIMDGYEVGFQIGVPLVGTSTDFKKNSAGDAYEWNEERSPRAANADELQELKDMFTGDDTPRKKYDELKQKRDSARTAASPGTPPKFLTSKNLDVEICFNLSIIFKYNPLDNGYYFSQASFLLSGSATFTFTVRLTVCPIVYAYFCVGLSINIGASINADRVKAVADTVEVKPAISGLATSAALESYYKKPAESSPYVGELSAAYYFYNAAKLGPNSTVAAGDDDFIRLSSGTSITYSSRYKAVDVLFNGRMLVSSDVPGFVGGVITSDGSEPVTVKLKSDINGLFDRAYTVTFTALPEENGDLKYSYVDSITPIERVATNVTFGGIEINPAVYVEIGAGIGVEVLKVEIFARVSLSVALAIAPQASGDTKGDIDTDPIRFTYFELAASLGLRVVLLFFEMEFEGIRLSVSYDWADRIKQDSGWRFTVYLGGQTMYSADISRSRSGGLPDAEALTVTVRPPVDLSSAQKLYTPDDNIVNPYIRALIPTDNRVPFELSGYSSSGDAFALGEGLQSGGDFRLVTLGGETYMAYIISRSDAVNSIDSTQLVLSKVRNTAPADSKAYGLVHPTDPTAQTPYLVIDNNPGGDLSFSIEADETANSLRLVWTTYADVSPASAAAAQTQAAAAARNAVVKTATLSLTAGLSAPVTISGTEQNYRFIPQSAGGLLFFAETEHFTQAEQAARNAAYEAAYGEVSTQSAYVNGELVTYTQDDPSGYYMKTQSQVMDSIYGKTTTLNFALPNAAGGHSLYSYIAPDWAAKGVRLEAAEVTQANANTYYLAYVTTIEDLVDGSEASTAYRESGNNLLPTSTAGQTRTIRQLYLQKVTVENGVPKLGQAALLRSLVDYKDNSLLSQSSSPLDGLYTNSTQVTAYEDPYLSNLRFLYGKLGTLTGTEENFNEAIEFQQRIRSLTNTPVEENFLLFEMNGETYIIPEASLAGITSETVSARKGYIIPFFGAAQGLAEGSGTTIGVDGNGTITAVYTKPVDGSPNNALYMTKYDAQSGTWGVGTMLAMHNMDIYERAIDELWTAEETEERYYDASYGGSMDRFSFRELDIALGGQDELVIVTRGTLTEMTRNPMYKSNYLEDADGATIRDINGNAVIGSVEQAVDENNVPVTIIEPKRNAAGGIISNTGMYVISYGVGQQSLANPAISFRDWNLAPGALLVPTLSFINGGDVAIRAGALQANGTSAHPISVKLVLGAISADGATIVSSDVLAEWQIHETIRAGASVLLDGTVITMPADCAGKVLYISVEEDAYFAGKPITSLAYSEFGVIVNDAASILVEAKPELDFQKLEAAVIDASSDKATIRLDAVATNMGAAEARPVYLRVQSVTTADDGTETFRPVNLNGHNLDISEEQQYRTRNLTPYTLDNGYLLLARENENPATAGRLGSGMGREITGTFTIPKSLFCGDDNSATLRFSLVIGGDEGETMEFTYGNNSLEKVLSPRTFFTAPAQLMLTMGSTLRLPLGVQSSSDKTPVITVTEVPEEDANGFSTGNLGVLYYDAASDAIVLSGVREGTGAVRISDVTTNSTLTLYYTVKGAGEGINIYNDNEIFTWSQSSDWRYLQLPGAWEGVATLRNDVSIGAAGTSVSFDSYAKSIDLYFDGTVTVTSTFPGFTPVTRTSDNIGQPVTIYFGENTTNQPYTIGITTVTAGTALDKYSEAFTDLDAVITTADPLAPNFYWGRSFPEAASIKAGGDSTIPLYVVDDSGIASVSVTMDGQSYPIDSWRINGAVGDRLWSLYIPFTANGTYTILASDTSGKVQSTTITVTWFNAAKDAITTDNPFLLTMLAELTDQDGKGINATAELAAGAHPYLSMKFFEAVPGKEADLSLFKVNTGADGTPVSQGFSPQESFPLVQDVNEYTRHALDGGNGLYMVEVVRDDGTFVRTIVDVPLDIYPAEQPTGSLALTTVNGLRYLDIKAQAELAATEKIPKLAKLQLTGPGFNETYAEAVGMAIYSGRSSEIVQPGEYTLTIQNTAGKTYSVKFTVTNAPITASVTAVTNAGDTRKGTITLQASGGYRGKYAYGYRLKDSAVDFAYVADTNTLTQLKAGVYEIQVRDELDHTNTSAVLTAEIVRLAVAVEQPQHGTITLTLPASLDAGSTVQVTVKPEDEYYVNALKILDNSGNTVFYNEHEVGSFSFIMPDAPVTVSAVVTQDPMFAVLIPVQPANGSLAASLSMAKQGETVTVTALPVDDYQLDAVTAVTKTGASVPLTNHGNGKFTFVMPNTRVMLSAVFSQIPRYDVTLPAQTPNGSLAVSHTRAKAGETVTLTPTPDYDYLLGHLTVTLPDGTPVVLTDVGSGSFSFVMPAQAVRIDASFTPVPRYEVILPARVANGIVSAAPMWARENDTVTITALPAQGYQLNSLSLIDANGQTVTYVQNPDGTYSFTMPACAVTVQISFESQHDFWLMVLANRYAQRYEITAAAGEGGTITPVGVTEVRYNRDQTYTITPHAGYAIASVLVDGVDMGAIDTYTFADVNRDHTISATFIKTGWTNPFADVAENDWFYADVEFLHAQGLLVDLPDAAFAPQAAASRAVIAVLLWRLAGSPMVESSAEFFDVLPGAWYADAVSWASASGIMQGYGNSLFGPDDAVTREQVVVILRRYAAQDGSGDSSDAVQELPYTCSESARDDVLWAYAHGLFDGVGSDLSDMTQAASRAELAALLHRFCRAVPVSAEALH